MTINITPRTVTPAAFCLKAICIVVIAVGGVAFADEKQTQKTAPEPQQCPAQISQLNDKDVEVAKIAWQYFENNIHSNGLVNSAHNFPSTTMWDTGSAIAGLLAAERMGLISHDYFNTAISQMMATLVSLDLFNGEVPNKVYHTKTMDMVDYKNKPSKQGIGVSALDLGRLASWLNILACLHPQHKEAAEAVIESWSLCRVINKGQMYGMGWDKKKNSTVLMQEGRLGYEQYAAKAFKQLGFKQDVAAVYGNKFAEVARVENVELLVDKRDASTLGAHNYVVSESYAMDAFEHGLDEENTPLLESIYEIQKRRWQRTGIVTAVSEDNLDRKPYFLYNTIYTNKTPWAAITDKGTDVSELRALSTKAAISMAYVFPERAYSKLLLEGVWNARNPKGGWYSGVYEDEALGINKATSANTNGVILSVMLSKMLGPLNRVCEQCNKGMQVSPSYVKAVHNQAQCKANLAKLTKAHKQASAQRLAARESILNKGKAFNAEINKTKGKRVAKVNAKKVMELHAMVTRLMEKRPSKENNQAADTLKKHKKIVWKLGDELSHLKPEFKRQLQSQMKAMDVAAKAIRKGDDAAAKKALIALQARFKQVASALETF